MRKPKVRTKKYLDWQDIEPYFSKMKGFNIDPIWDYFMQRDFHNGCFVMLELHTILDPDEEVHKDVQWFVKKLYEKWPSAFDRSKTVELYVWW